MKSIWEYFEKLDEMVYVSDIETYEMLYMNAYLRKTLGYNSDEEYRGEKCYKILQGRETPCPFCTNQKLEEEKFVSWSHKNPVINKRFLVKDSTMDVKGRKCRMEIAIDIDSEIVSGTSYYYARSETIINECLQRISSTSNPEESLAEMLAYIGEVFLCERTYIFEIQNEDRMSNTYEWCAEGIIPQKEMLQGEALDAIGWWIQEFKDNKAVIIDNLEEIRESHPATYALLKPQGISSLIVGAIRSDGEIMGFFGVDNPNIQMKSLITSFINVIGYSMVSLLKRRNLLRKLNELSYHDQLTGALNRNALAEYYCGMPMNSVGVIYCDITGLKQINDTMGHEAGDKMICYCYNLISETLNTDMIYRTGGDEFVVLCSNCNSDEFYKNVSRLCEAIRQGEYHIAVGYVWSDSQPLVLESLIAQADEVMYKDKRQYYSENFMVPGVDRRTRTELSDLAMKSDNEPFYRFLMTTYYDIEVIFRSIAQDNSSSYFYFGDMQKDLFYISDNMRDDFGFQGNIVSGLLKRWAQNISTPEFRELYWQDMSDILEKKRTVHDIQYQVRDVKGRDMWIRCYGVLKWSEDKSKPLFFSGRVTHQDENFVVDPITNFPREHQAFLRLTDVQKKKEKVLVIGFSFNNISEINHTKGRPHADRLVKNIANELTKSFSRTMSFYRLEGMRCIAIADFSTLPETQDKLVSEIRAIIEDCYHRVGVAIHQPCSFGVMVYPCDALTPEDLVENMVSLIKVARQDPKLAYAEYSFKGIQKIKQMSNMALALNHDILSGMEHFRIMVQPVVSAANGRVIGGEVLMRWRFEGKDISPAVFIPILEKENMIHLAGRWVFEQAVCTCMRIIVHNPDFYLTFNVSLHQLSDLKFTEYMSQILDKYHFDGSHLVAELTESCLDEEPEKLISFLEACQKMGIRIALDDFGSGYSSLRMLLQYPSSIIKLDRFLLAEMTESDDKKKFISSIVYACHQFGKNVCMEGVETEVQDCLIKESGCDMIQGFYYYRPMEIKQIYELLGKSTISEK